MNNLNKAYKWLTRVYKKLEAENYFQRRDLIPITPYLFGMTVSYKLKTSKITYVVDVCVMEEISDGDTEFPTIFIAENAVGFI